MGFVTNSMGPADEAAIHRLSSEIVQALRRACVAVRNGRADGESRKWFGDTSDEWMSILYRKLNRLASLINLLPIEIGFGPLAERDRNYIASALRPACGWKNISKGRNFLARAQRQDYRIVLNEGWNHLLLHSPMKRPSSSKFMCLVHECSHLFLGTDDHAYGVARSEVMACINPMLAKKNADNWGLFAEEFHQAR